MTTIAYADGTIAADTLATWHTNRDGHFIKIAKRAGHLAGVSGAVAPAQRFLDWFTSGCVGDPPAMPEGDKGAHGVIITPDDHVLTFGPTGWERTRNPIVTMGSGGEYAQGAIAAGATPAEAVRIAMLFDTKSGGDVTVLSR